MRTLRDLPDHSKQWDQPASSGSQLPMFMTAREITSSHQALDGDRYEVYVDEPHDTENYDRRAGMLTNRPQNTAGEANLSNRNIRSWGGPKKVWGRSEGGTRRQMTVEGFSHQRPMARSESDPQVWSRKYDEAHMDEESYRDARGEDYSPKFQRADGGLSSGEASWTHMSAQFDSKGSLVDDSYTTVRRYRDQVGGGSLRDSIHEAGGVRSPINLTAEKGSLGKPQIAGGHHRLAVMLHDKPNDLIPVLHNETFGQARGSKYYRYT